MRKFNRGLLLLAVSVGLTGLAALVLVPGERSLDSEILPEPEPLDRPGQVPCPPSALGPQQVRLPEGFCIDTTEVTRAQYAEWLETEPSSEGQPDACAANDDFTPGCGWPPGGGGDQPVVCVDWCDARAFCEAAGKRLCGRIGDGEGYPFDEYDDPAVSEWHAACTSGGRYAYTYGDEVDTTVCRGADADDHTTWGLAAAGSFPGCHSREADYAAVHDLSGHVAEWDGSCEGDAPDAPCRIRGGSYEHHTHGLRCAMGRALRWPRMRQVGSVGFRCCAD